MVCILERVYYTFIIYIYRYMYSAIISLCKMIINSINHAHSKTILKEVSKNRYIYLIYVINPKLSEDIE